MRSFYRYLVASTEDDLEETKQNGSRRVSGNGSSSSRSPSTTVRPEQHPAAARTTTTTTTTSEHAVKLWLKQDSAGPIDSNNTSSINGGESSRSVNQHENLVSASSMEEGTTDTSGAPPAVPTETSLLLPKEPEQNGHEKLATTTLPPSPFDFYFNSTSNPSVQRYYRFTSTAFTPIAALYKRPMTTAASSASDLVNNSSNNNSNAGITGLLRRSAVVPSHGMDSVDGEWILVSVGGRSGWARRKTNRPSSTLLHHQNSITTSPPTMPPPPTGYFVPATQFTAAEAWMGNHSFFCNGKLMLGSDAPSLFLSFFLIVAGAGLYFIVLLPDLRTAFQVGQQQQQGAAAAAVDNDNDNDQWSWLQLLPPQMWLLANDTAIFWLSVFVVLGTLFFLWAAAVIDPGIIPAVSSPVKAVPPVDDKTGEVVTMGGPVGYRYCSTCNIFRPPRSKHCNSCNVCVSSFDHHCPWVGNCIGERNYAVFVWFLLFVSVLTALTTASSFTIVAAAYHKQQLLHKLAAEEDTSALNEAIREYGGTLAEPVLEWQHNSHLFWYVICHNPVPVLFGTVTGLCAWSLISLFFYHCRIISIGQTTNERVRGVYSRDTVNPADHGCCGNWGLCLRRSIGRDVPPSRLPRDFSEVVHECQPVEETVWSGETSQSLTPRSRNASQTSLAPV